MESYPAPARALVAQMAAAAAADPDRAVAFQGAPGANSNIAVTQAFPDGLPLPCFSFEDAIDAVREGRAAADPAALVEAPRLPRSLPKALTEAEVEALAGGMALAEAEPSAPVEAGEESAS